MPSGFLRTMNSRWHWQIAGLLGLLVTVVFLLWLRLRPDPRVEAMLEWNDLNNAAVDTEVILAELPLLDDRAIRRLADEPFRDDGPWYKIESWLMNSNLPQWLMKWMPVLTPRSLVKKNALKVLTLLGPRARPFANRIATLGTNYGSAYADDAAFALVMIQGADPTNFAKFVPWASSANESQQFEFAMHCAFVGTNPPLSQLPILIRALSSPDERNRSRAAYAISLYGSAASNAVPALRKCLSDPDLKVRPTAAFALGFVAPEFADEAVAVMLNPTSTNSTRFKDCAHQLYARLGPAAHAAIPWLESELADPKMKMWRGAAAVALWRIRHEATPTSVEALAWDIEHGVQRSRRWSLQALAEIGPPATNALPAIKRMTRHPRLLLRQMAQTALSSVMQTPASAH